MGHGFPRGTRIIQGQQNRIRHGGSAAGSTAVRAPKASTPSSRDALGQGGEFPENRASQPSICGRSSSVPPSLTAATTTAKNILF